jgi:hypothetical protein
LPAVATKVAGFQLADGVPPTMSALASANVQSWLAAPASRKSK